MPGTGGVSRFTLHKSTVYILSQRHMHWHCTGNFNLVMMDIYLSGNWQMLQIKGFLRMWEEQFVEYWLTYHSAQLMCSSILFPIVSLFHFLVNKSENAYSRFILLSSGKARKHEHEHWLSLLDNACIISTNYEVWCAHSHEIVLVHV